jgi:hypothetical protein
VITVITDLNGQLQQLEIAGKCLDQAAEELKRALVKVTGSDKDAEELGKAISRLIESRLTVERMLR